MICGKMEGQMEISFRKATFEDVESIIALCNECFDENTSIQLLW